MPSRKLKADRKNLPWMIRVDQKLLDAIKQVAVDWGMSTSQVARLHLEIAMGFRKPPKGFGGKQA